jgi:hypothetical protein
MLPIARFAASLLVWVSLPAAAHAPAAVAPRANAPANTGTQ